MKPFKLAYTIQQLLRTATIKAYLADTIYHPNDGGLLQLRYPNDNEFVVVHAISSNLENVSSCTDTDEQSVQIDLYANSLTRLYGGNGDAGFYKQVSDLLTLNKIIIGDTIPRAKHNDFYSISGFIHKGV